MAGIGNSVKNFFTSAFRPPSARGEAAEPSVVDHGKKAMEEAGEKTYVWINERSPWVAERIGDAAAVASELESQGYARHFKAFNESLLKPLTSGLDSVVGQAKAAATFSQTLAPSTAFALWNVLTFWLTIVLLIIELLLPFGWAVAELLSAGTSYLAAYTFYFLFIVKPRRRWMQGGLVLIGLSAAANLFAGVGGAIFILPALISFTKAAASGILFAHAFKLYQQAAGVEEGGGAAEMF